MYIWLLYFEKFVFVEDNSIDVDGLFFASNRMTWVDYVMFDFLDIYVEFGRFNFGDDEVFIINVLENFLKFKVFYEYFVGRFNIVKYFKVERRVLFRL